MRKWLVVLALFIAFVFALTACGDSASSGNGEDSDSSDRLTQLQEDGTVVVGFANEKPYAYEEDGELKGVAVDVATAVLNELGIENVEGHLADFGQLIPGLEAKKYDIITASMAINAERCENVAFGEPEVKYGEGLIVEAGNPLNLHSYKDIADNPDVTVAIMSGATEIEFVQIEGVDPNQIQNAPDIPATFSAVESGRAQATTGTEMTIKMALESLDSDKLEFVEDFEQPNIEGVPSYGAAAFRLDDNELREAYNEKLAELKESDLYGELLEANYFNATSNAVESDITTEMVCSGEVYE
ncbi:ectoine/hydroxyectoine ABC transporter substrate-binding protein EhuB [Pseudogracilibacillus auburnensis]|uniref:ectoine/hydroxyectoine ABC transporter substrate-binding protein EhuB n=1 Tax=Pseudogracilibacillus auburnensis TaxID=1494959 RepID=UPI001A977046|nr:ectoine/hydroxyectoine ABC transporter substrate-binding protein EhuB [Pseudogracilibacillus auburnensis]MBO1001620.1 ectoine/hydroxyectoine ABC transporter substrate-binding protein EhuB [Pseudogracilibacillus auburnensis]